MTINEDQCVAQQWRGLNSILSTSGHVTHHNTVGLMILAKSPADFLTDKPRSNSDNERDHSDSQKKSSNTFSHAHNGIGTQCSALTLYAPT